MSGPKVASAVDGVDARAERTRTVRALAESTDASAAI